MWSDYVITPVPGWPGTFMVQPGPTHVAKYDLSSVNSDAERLILPETVESLGPGCFEGFCNLREIEIPASVVSIGKRAFAGCASLERIRIPASVKRLGKVICLGAQPKEISLPGHLCPEGLTPEEILGIPDEDGFIGEGETLWSYVGPQTSNLKVPDKYTRISWESVPNDDHPRFERLTLPVGLEFLDIPDTFLDRVSFSPGYLRQEDFLPVRVTAELICGTWREDLTAHDLAALFLFQKPSLSDKALDQSRRFAPRDFARAIVDVLPQDDVRESWKRAAVWMTGFGFGPYDDIGREFAEKLRKARGLPEPSVWSAVWDYVLKEAGISLTPELASHVALRGSSEKAETDLIKASLAPYAARGHYICRSAFKRLGPIQETAERAAAQLDLSTLSGVLDDLCCYSRSGDNQHVIPYLRYGSEAQIRRFLRPCSGSARTAAIRNGRHCTRGASCLLCKMYLPLSNSCAALEFAMCASDCADRRNVTFRHPLDYYLRERSDPALPEIECGVPGGEKEYFDPEGRPVMTLRVKDGEICLRLPNGDAALTHIPPSLCADEGTEKRIRRDLRTIIKIRSMQLEAVRDLIADRWIDGRGYAPDLWANVFERPFFAESSAGVVWKQNEKTFVRDGSTLMDADGSAYHLKDSAPILVAYPSDMDPQDIRTWRAKLSSLKKRSFPRQLDDPVYTERDMDPCRYAGFVVSPKTLKMDRDRMFLWETVFGEARSLRNGTRIDFRETTEGFVLGRLTISASDRETNHLLYLLDLLTLEERFRNDDATLAPLLLASDDDELKAWQLRVMEEQKMVKLRALILEETHKRFRDATSAAEFLLV